MTDSSGQKDCINVAVNAHAGDLFAAYWEISFGNCTFSANNYSVSCYTTQRVYTCDGMPFTKSGMDAGNEQLNINTATYEYDLNGNRTKKTDSGSVTNYVYDDENRLIQVTDSANTITYAYDPFGRRIEKNVNGSFTSYLYDSEDIIAEYDGAGNVRAKYTHGPGIDEPLAVQQSTTKYYYHADGLGSIVALSNSSGTIAQRYRYDAFGRMTQSGSITQPFTYTAREYDTETGLYYYRARYYDPKAGRFITKDPISFNGGDVNLYAYVGNNPVNLIDPEGLRFGIPRALSPRWNPKTQAPRTKPAPSEPPPVRPAKPNDPQQPPTDGWKLYGPERPEPLAPWGGFEPISGPDIGGVSAPPVKMPNGCEDSAPYDPLLNPKGDPRI